MNLHIVFFFYLHLATFLLLTILSNYSFILHLYMLVISSFSLHVQMIFYNIFLSVTICVVDMAGIPPFRPHAEYYPVV